MPWICRTCGVEQSPADQPPAACAICTDERQYVLPSGPAWTTASELVDAGFGLRVEELEPDLWGFTAEPKVGIGQTALLARTPGGHLLFDVPPFVAPEALRLIGELGGVAAIMASHPHMYGSQVAWSHALGGVPVYVADADLAWVQRTDPLLVSWSQPFDVLPGVPARQVGGHFRGQTIVRWPGADGAGVLLVGDACSVRPDGNVSFLRSYPNLIPLSPRAIGQIVAGFDAFDYDRLYDNFAGRLAAGAANIVHFSADRYVAWITGAHDDLV
ncbi:MBL fold metallo-hydrolase [Micropruina glycogenica]|nr:hydrolase [Micropruina glycogenica]